MSAAISDLSIGGIDTVFTNRFQLSPHIEWWGQWDSPQLAFENASKETLTCYPQAGKLLTQGPQRVEEDTKNTLAVAFNRPCNPSLKRKGRGNMTESIDCSSTHNSARPTPTLTTPKDNIGHIQRELCSPIVNWKPPFDNNNTESANPVETDHSVADAHATQDAHPEQRPEPLIYP